MTTPSTAVTVQTSRGAIQLNLDRTYRAEARIIEVAQVTRHKAPELMSTFNRAFLDMAKDLAVVKDALLSAKRNTRKIRARVILDQAPKKLADAGLRVGGSGSKEFLEAIVETDPEYQVAIEQENMLEALYELFREKKMAFGMAFSMTKKIFEENAYDHSRPLNGSIADNAQAGQVVNQDGEVLDITPPVVTTPPPIDPKASLKAQFGRAR